MGLRRRLVGAAAAAVVLLQLAGAAKAAGAGAWRPPAYNTSAACWCVSASFGVCGMDRSVSSID